MFCLVKEEKKIMKKTNALMMLGAVTLLSACSFRLNINNDLFSSTGTVNQEEEKTNVRKLYRDGVETAEDLENLDDEGTVTEGETTTEEGGTTEGETPTEGGEGETTEGEETPEEITSYHVDYSYDYAIKASIDGYTIIDRFETESYSLTRVNEENGVWMELNRTHAYKANDYFSGSEEVNAIFQDNVLYLSSNIVAGQYTYSEKAAFEIHKKHIHNKFGDFFRYTYLDLLFVEGNKEESYSLLDVLLEQENVTVTDVKEDRVSISFTNENFDATITFNTQKNYIVSASFDTSKVLRSMYEEIIIAKEGKEGNVFSLDEIKEVVTMNFSYNESEANRLSEEQIAEYQYRGNNNYGHYNDHHGYGEEQGGHHDGHGHDSDDWGYDEGNNPDHGDDDYGWGWGNEEDDHGHNGGNNHN